MNKSNPFKKRNTLDASERTKILKSTTMMQSLSSSSPSNVSKNVTLRNNHLVSTLNYELLLNYYKIKYGLVMNSDPIIDLPLV